jgi:hypothetical protein
MSNTTTIREPDTIRSGDIYTTDPSVDVIERVEPTQRTAATPAARNDFKHVRDARPVVTSALAFVSVGLFVLSILMLTANVIPTATLLAFGGIAAGLIGVFIGRARTTTAWNYRLAGYAAIGSAVLATLLVVFNSLAI